MMGMTQNFMVFSKRLLRCNITQICNSVDRWFYFDVIGLIWLGRREALGMMGTSNLSTLRGCGIRLIPSYWQLNPKRYFICKTLFSAKIGKLCKSLPIGICIMWLKM